MSIKDCINVIKKAAGDTKITDDQAEALLSDIDDFIQLKKQATQDANVDATVSKYVDDRLQESILQAAIEKRNNILNLIAETKAMARVDKFKDKQKGLMALMVGVYGEEGGKLSIDAQGKALANKYIGRLIDRVDKDGDLGMFNSGKIDHDIAAELWEIKEGGTPGITKNPAAERIAKNIHELQNTAVSHSNQAGTYIRNMPGYIMRQSHDMLRLRKAGGKKATPEESFKAWYNFIIDKLDHEATFKGADPEKFLRGAYEGLTSGFHKRFNAADESNFVMGFKGPANIAKKSSQPRLLHFRTSSDFMAYNGKFGTGDLREGIIHGLEHMARNTALMRGLGTNPVAMMDKLKRKYALAASKELSWKQADKFKHIALENALKEIDGTTRIPAKLTFARINAGVRAVQNMARLGAATISSFTDIPNQAAELRFQGVHPLVGYSRAFGNLLRGRGNKEQKTIARSLGIGFDGMTGDLISRWAATDHVPGTLAKGQQKFFKLNLMSWWNDSHRTGVALMMSHNLASNKNLTFNKLGQRLQNVLALYDIGQAEWNIFRNHLVTEVDGNAHMLPEGAQYIPEGIIVDYLKRYKGIKEPTRRRIEIARTDLESMLDTFYMDRADSGIPMPGAAERAIMNQGTQSGTWTGEMFRHFFQFKSFPITMIRKGVARELFGNLNGKKDISGLSQLIVMTTLFGYASLTAKSYLRGQTPREFTDDPGHNAKLLFAAMSQGGGLGIYGDFLFGEYSRYGRSALATAAGPTLGQFDTVMDIYTRIRQGKDFKADLLRTAINNTPFINLFYTRMALDYLILYQLQETMNPGYLRRMERRIMREQGQQFRVPPSHLIPRGGGDRLFEGVR